MTTTLHDVVSSYLNGLQQVENFTQSTVHNCQNADNTFKGRRDALLDYEVGFSGLGAMAFSNSVDQNLLRSQHILTKLDNVREASNHVRQMIESTTNDNDTALAVPAPYYGTGLDYALGHFNYVFMDVQHRLRDDTLSGVGIDSVLDPHTDTLKDRLDTTKQAIYNDLESRMNTHLHELDGIRVDPNDVVAVSDQKQRIQDEHNKLDEAKQLVNLIAGYVSDKMEAWRANLQNLTAGYIQSVIAAANIDAVSTGEIIHQLAQSGAPIMIWRASDGSLIVGVNDFHNGKSDTDNAKLVEYAINQYIQENGIQGPVHITMVGYMNGGTIAQQTATDVGSNQRQYQYQINNEVLVGSSLTGTPQYNTEYDAYSFSRDISTSGGWGPIFAPDVIGLGSDLATGVSSTTVPGMVANYLAGVGENAYNRQYNAAQTQLQGMDPNHIYSVDPRSVDHVHLLPDEPGAHDPSIFSSTHYDQSAYLNEVALPDPIQTSNLLPGNNVTRVDVTAPTTGTLSAPTSYYVTQGQPPNSYAQPVTDGSYYQ